MAGREGLLRGLTHKEVKRYVRDLVRDGWNLEDRGKGKMTLVAPDRRKFMLHTTQSSNGAARQLAANLRRAGYDVPRK